MRNFSSMVFLSSVILLFPLAVNGAATSTLTPSLSPAKVNNGQVSLLRLALPAGTTEWPTNLSAKAFDIALPLVECGKGGAKRCALVPVDFDTKAGKHEVIVSWQEAGEPKSAIVVLRVVQGKYPISTLKVDPSRVKPSPEEQARAAREKEEINAAYAAAEKAPLWVGKFDLPCKGGVTSRFGNMRRFNGELKSVHLGTDLRANEQTILRAANAGRVVIAKETFYAGNFVLLDHGAGLFTGYAHMSVIGVAVGQMVQKGDRLGNAGSTGRVTGPHLHWTSRVQSIAVDPLQMREVFNSMAR